MRSNIAKVTDIKIEKDAKYWVVVYFDNGSVWYPKLTEMGKICSGIGKCEDKKYPNGKGYKMVMDFINLCYNKTREEIERLYVEKFDPNGVTVESKSMLKCPSCGRPTKAEGECDLCKAANKGWNIKEA